ncbi:sensor histidine kinase [Halpernia sp. GG3]
MNELSDLNASLNELAANNKKVYQSQKEFTENASHELQTPLAIIQNNVELFWQTEGISASQATILDDISNATVRMTKLNQSLLLLSKIENRQFSETQIVNFNDIANQFISNYQEQIKFKNLRLRD